MDIHLPVMNGYETAYQIRSLDRMDAKTIPIIAMSTDDLSKSPETISPVSYTHLTLPTN